MGRPPHPPHAAHGSPPSPRRGEGRCGGERRGASVDDALTEAEIAQYRRDGYLVVRGLLGAGSVAACRQALSDLAAGRIAARETTLMFEFGTSPETLSADERELRIRKYMDFVEDAPALKAAAMNRRLHRILDQQLGDGRVLFQEMALVKPPRTGAANAWHQH